MKHLKIKYFLLGIFVCTILLTLIGNNSLVNLLTVKDVPAVAMSNDHGVLKSIIIYNGKGYSYTLGKHNKIKYIGNLEE